MTASRRARCWPALLTGVDYELAVIGGGAAGLAAADAARRARVRVRVVLIAAGELGGDCTFTGCVPSKTLIDAAAQGYSFTDAMARVHATVARIAATETADVLRRPGIDVIRGRASITDPGTLDVDGRRVRVGKIVIATGAAPALPQIPGLATVPYLTTDTVFGVTARPRSLVVLGGGAVGCELAQAFARLGVDVSVVEATDRLLPGIDPDAADVLAAVFAEEGIAVHTGTDVTDVTGDADGVVLHTTAGADITAQLLLVAVGRTPVTDGLGLIRAGVHTDDRGCVVVDRHMATNVDRVFAAGDVTGLFPHTHGAAAMGRVAAGSALHRHRRPSFDPTHIPMAVFTDPEIATVGVAEHDIGDPRARVAYLPLTEVDRAITADRTRGFVKLVAGPRPILGRIGGGSILGATIVAPRAGELIHEPALAMRTGMFAGRLAQLTHIYPSWSISVQQAAAQFVGYGTRPARPVRGADH